MNNSTSARKKILANLRESPVAAKKYPRNDAVMERKSWTEAEKILQLKSMMEAVHTEVIICTENDWENTLRDVVKEKEIGQLLYGSKTALAEKLRNMRQQTPDTMRNWLITNSRLKKARIYCLGLTQQSPQHAAELRKPVR